MRKNLSSFSLAVLTLCVTVNFTAFAGAETLPKRPYPFLAVETSRAFQQFKTRPDNNLSRLIYLIDRFGDFDILIRYDNYDYNAQFAARIARWFLTRRYNGEGVDKWIMQWCNTSIGTGALIWVKLPDGSFRLAREILFEEIRALDHGLKQSAHSQKPMETNPTSLSNQLLVLPANTPSLSAAPLAQIQFKTTGDPAPNK